MTTIPYVVTRRHGDERQTDIYSAMLNERAVFINGEINDDMASAVVAELQIGRASCRERV